MGTIITVIITTGIIIKGTTTAITTIGEVMEESGWRWGSGYSAIALVPIATGPLPIRPRTATPRRVTRQAMATRRATRRLRHQGMDSNGCGEWFQGGRFSG